MSTNTEQTTFIKKSIQAGIDRHATRRALISEGIPTEGFDEAYAATLAELGVPEPKPPMPKLPPSGETPLKAIGVRRTPLRFLTKFLIVMVLFGGAVYLGLYTQIFSQVVDVVSSGLQQDTATTKENAGGNFSDSILRTKVDATMASVKIARSRMLDYEGVCSDVSVVAPVVCSERKETVVVFAPQSNGTLYCVDGKGNAGKEFVSTESTVTCK